MSTRIATARKGRDQGFTLIEILVVIIIIGVLAAIAIPLYLNQRKKAVDASLKSDLKNIALIGMAIVEDGPYPQYQSRPDLGLTDGFNPASWLPAGSVNRAQPWTSRDLKFTPGNRIHVGGQPRAGEWQLCAWNPGASTAIDRTTAMGYDEDQGGLVESIDCTVGDWPAIVPYFDGVTSATSWWE